MNLLVKLSAELNTERPHFAAQSFSCLVHLFSLFPEIMFAAGERGKVGHDHAGGGRLSSSPRWRETAVIYKTNAGRK